MNAVTHQSSWSTYIVYKVISKSLQEHSPGEFKWNHLLVNRQITLLKDYTCG